MGTLKYRSRRVASFPSSKLVYVLGHAGINSGLVDGLHIPQRLFTSEALLLLSLDKLDSLVAEASLAAVGKLVGELLPVHSELMT